jgi:hypothetical protein
MIDSTRAPRPAWQRYGVPVLLVIFIAVAAFMIWSKELHHSSSPAASTPTSPAITATHAAPRAKAPATTIPGGLPVSGRNPFGS